MKAPTPVTCPACGKRLRISPSAAGKTVQCPACLEDLPVALSVPAAVPAPAPAAAPAESFDFDTSSPAEDDSPSAPYFTVVEPRNWSINREYRIFVRPKERELIGIFSGAAADNGVLVITNDPDGRKARKQAQREAEMLDELREAHPMNFSFRVKEIESAEVFKPSFWFWLGHMAVPQVGHLRLITRDDNRRFAFATAVDARRALDLLPPLLGDRLDVGIVWDSGQRRFRGA